MSQKSQQHTNKTQRKKLKKEELRKAKEREKLGKLIFKWGWISLGTLFTLGIVYAIFFHSPNVSQAGTLRVAVQEHNFGMIPIQGGVVSTDVPIINIGEGPLTIAALESSCGCTTAKIVNQGKKGPIFGMAGHGNNPKNWRTTIPSGEQALL